MNKKALEIAVKAGSLLKQVTDIRLQNLENSIKIDKITEIIRELESVEKTEFPGINRLLIAAHKEILETLILMTSFEKPLL